VTICENPACTIHPHADSNETARVLVAHFGKRAEALAYARKIAAVDGPLAQEYHEAANIIALSVEPTH
jgi:hypothetical protein